MTKNTILEKLAIQEITEKYNFKSPRFCIGVWKRLVYKAYIVYTFVETEEIYEVEVIWIDQLKAVVRYLEDNWAIIKKLEIVFI